MSANPRRAKVLRIKLTHRLRRSLEPRFALAAGLVVTAAILLALILTTQADSPQPPVELGDAKSFAVLAGSGITNTGDTVVSGTNGGDLGSSPTSAFTGSATVTTTGTKYLAVEPAVVAAKDSLLLAYQDAASRTPGTTIAADLGGQTLTQGVYNSASSIGLTGTLILDGQDDPSAVFIFQAGSTLTTASASIVELINGAQACNVYWQVGSSATFGTYSFFVGHVFAQTSITATTEASFEGALMALDGAVTLDTNTILNDDCVEIAVEPTDEPTTEPTDEPTVEPTVEPTATATPEPTAEPTTEPTLEPTAEPTAEPTPEQTATATATPEPVATTTTGGELPDTGSTRWLLTLGGSLLGVGAGVGLLFARRR
jgi:LPXTG-motif cell wall-anchored protein